MDETKLSAALPNMTMEILHRQAEDGRGEHVTIHLTATPDLRSALPLVAGMAQLPMMLGGGTLPSPLALWTQTAQAMMAPWLALARTNPFLALPADQNSGKPTK